MKQFLITLLPVGVLASAAQAEARLVSKRGECVVACGQAISDGCGWLTKRGKFNRCRAKLINQCKHFGTARVCPPSPPPSSPTGPTTTTTLPPPPPTTTTTTVPYIPPTTTTLPPPPSVVDLRGSYSFSGTVTSDNCGLSNGVGTAVQIPFSVTTQVGTSLAGVVGSDPRPATGTLFDDLSWGLTAQFCQDGCCYVEGVAVGDVATPALGYAGFRGDCPGYASCVVEFDGTVY